MLLLQSESQYSTHLTNNRISGQRRVGKELELHVPLKVLPFGVARHCVAAVATVAAEHEVAGKCPLKCGLEGDLDVHVWVLECALEWDSAAAGVNNQEIGLSQ